MKTKLKYQINEPFASELIKARGIENIEQFLTPTSDNLQSMFDLLNMREAVELVESMVGKPTLLVVDSDCDGYCSAAMLYQYLTTIYPDWKIDAVHHEGKQHGLADIESRLDLSDYALVLLPDSGTNDDEICAQYSFTDFLILDHHIRESEEEAPDNMLIVNNQTSPLYLNKYLSGGGVTWRFLQAYDYIFGFNFSDCYMDLAAVSIIGDVMDITTLENRYIISQGLKNIKNGFLQTLVNNASYQLGNGPLAPMGIAFYIVPYINAMCRMGLDDEKERMWLSFTNPLTLVESHKRGVEKGTQVPVVQESVRECTNVKARQKRMQEKMAELCAKRILEDDLEKNKIMVIQLDDTFDGMPPELNGLTATKIANETGHPTLIVRENSNGILKGSMRGLTTIDMPPFKDFLLSSGKFEFVSGHQNAAGVALPSSQLDSFTAWANEQLKDIDLNEKFLPVDFELDGGDRKLGIVIREMDKLKRLWGQGFPEAQISVKNLTFSAMNLQVMGKNADTVKIEVNGVAYMFFRRSIEEVKKLRAISIGKMNVVGTANLNTFAGRQTPQIFVSEYEILG